MSGGGDGSGYRDGHGDGSGSGEEHGTVTRQAARDTGTTGQADTGTRGAPGHGRRPEDPPDGLPGEEWSGEWVARRLGVRLEPAPGEPDGRLRGLLGLALRRNPRRAHLLVSQVLGKHVPQLPRVVHGTGLALGERVRELLGADADRAVVLGYAETATGLGHSVADGLRTAPYLHSTRRAVPGAVPVGGFEEEHSHATSHLLLPEDPALLAGDGPLVLVDDEFSTGTTVRNTITALHRAFPRERYVIVALSDLRGAADRARLEKFAAELGARIDVVALATGTVRLPADVLERGAALVEAHDGPPPEPAGEPGEIRRVEPGWPLGLPDGGRHGFTPAHRARLEAALPAMAGRLAAALPPGARRVLVLGCEELMYAPLRLAGALADLLADGSADGTGGPGAEVRFSTTTRSPVLAVDEPGYAIRTRLVFPAHDDPADAPAGGTGPRYAYNVHSTTGAGFDAVVAVVDSAADTPALHAPDGLPAQLAAHTGRVLLAVIPSHRPLPAPLRGPAFSSYAPGEVGWLLQDLSEAALEAPTEEREEAIQSGGAHYAESLPVEYQPSEAYQKLFHQALDASAARIARAVGTVTDTLLAERGRRDGGGGGDGGGGVVLASLARAGTPVGALMRRWARQVHGLELPHYAVSIVRGRGIDTTALRWLAAHHDPADVVFVDGWTGKGAITRELADALRPFPGFDPELAVLADPGGCVRTYGTREDFLIPSACLNSTVSGLVSRTVLRADLVGPDDFHGAKFYRELAPSDVSGLFLDTVTARFDEVREQVAADVRALLAADRAPTWAGWRAVERISEEYGIGDVNLVKPGVGETTRVLLRRVPWRVLARRGAGADLDHIRLLAEQRGVPVEEADDLPYSCVGLIHPRYTRGATGADGKAAR
ncbi:phosphoribosyltransferase [Streptomyces sp. TRM 70361]|uniref:phosphoribosyltransferase n=1 Tax=Streptomyces sp. TRM 70361 TaxID=3116553 RepID=UPI002E7C2DDE|nr:phosphoribosyltransferase [Streptomyces sp. TRM 70361]MEE1939769.1 phosphoribosyltransferase [Streptomyces sp. TRM 70361]